MVTLVFKVSINIKQTLSSTNCMGKSVTGCKACPHVHAHLPCSQNLQYLPYTRWVPHTRNERIQVLFEHVKVLVQTCQGPRSNAWSSLLECVRVLVWTRESPCLNAWESLFECVRVLIPMHEGPRLNARGSSFKHMKVHVWTCAVLVRMCLTCGVKTSTFHRQRGRVYIVIQNGLVMDLRLY